MTNPATITRVEQEALEMIADAAAMGGKCPSNIAIANRTNCESSSVSTMLRALEHKGYISVERGQNKRIVTILATGARTFGSITPSRPRSSSPAPRPPVAQTPPPPEPEPAPSREPCPRCGVRQDIHAEMGCKRWRAA